MKVRHTTTTTRTATTTTTTRKTIHGITIKSSILWTGTYNGNRLLLSPPIHIPFPSAHHHRHRRCYTLIQISFIIIIISICDSKAFHIYTCSYTHDINPYEKREIHREWEKKHSAHAHTHSEFSSILHVYTSIIKLNADDKRTKHEHTQNERITEEEEKKHGFAYFFFLSQIA